MLVNEHEADGQEAAKQPQPTVPTLLFYNFFYNSLGSPAENEMHRFPKFLIVVVALTAVVAILFVLVTPAPDELPSTGPHSLSKLFVPVADAIYWSDSPLFTSHNEMTFPVVSAGVDLLSLTCSRLC